MSTNHNCVVFDLGDESTSAEWAQIRKVTIQGRRVIFCVAMPNDGDGFSFYELLESQVDDLQQEFIAEGYMRGQPVTGPLPERFHSILRSRCQAGATFKAFQLVSRE